jgi:hypothetical protein
VPRIRILLVAAGFALACTDARAQVTGSFNDPFAPKLETDPRQPPRFEPVGNPSAAQADKPTTFTLPPSGIGKTGFDSTNARKKARPREMEEAPAELPPDAGVQPAATPVSPYQQPVPLASDSGTAALAAAPGAPPVKLGPIRRPPKQRKAHPDEPIDPYAPLGIDAGAFTLYPAIELIGGYSSNPSGTPDGEGAALYTVAPEMRVQSNWSRHELKADLRGSYTGYSPDETPTLSRPYVNGNVNGRIDVTRDTRIDLGSHVLVSTDNPGSPNLRADLAELPVYTTVGGSAGIGHRFNRLEVSIKGLAERTSYEDSKLTDGTTASNEDRNYDQLGGVLRGSYELTPGVKPFVEVGVDTREHATEFDQSGFQRNSKGVTGLVGTTFELTRQLTGEIAIGYTRREYDDPRLEEIKGLIGSASLVWIADALTTVKLSAESSVGETTIPGASGILYRDVGLQVDHAFRRWLIGSLKFGFGLDDYVGIERQDQRYFAGAGLTYKLSRSLQLKGEFRQDWLSSNVSGNDYSASTVLLGVRVQR